MLRYKNSVTTEQVKIQRCLEGKIREICQAAVEVVPFMVSALESISRNLSASWDSLGIPGIIRSAQVAALLRTVHVMSRSCSRHELRYDDHHPTETTKNRKYQIK